MEGSFLVLAVGNGRQAGGGHRLFPEALLDDGLLDVRVLPKLPREELPEALRALLRDGLHGVRRALVGARLPWLEIQTDEPLQINLDGEPLTDTRFRFEILPRRLPMRLPAGLSTALADPYGLTLHATETRPPAELVRMPRGWVVTGLWLLRSSYASVCASASTSASRSSLTAAGSNPRLGHRICTGAPRNA